MRKRAILFLLMLSISMPLTAHAEPLVVGNDQLEQKFNILGETDDTTRVVVKGAWISGSTELSLVVKDYAFLDEHHDAALQWLDEAKNYPKTSFNLIAVRTEVEYHEPYGILETVTELVKTQDSSTEYDWYDVTISQKLTPGSNSSGSGWEWSWLTYTVNGSFGGSNVFLSDYDPPQNEELPTGIFSFLWRLLNFNPRDYVPWLFPPPQRVEGIDLSDFSVDVYSVRYYAPDGFQKTDEPLEVRHRFVLRIPEGEKPVIWQYSQVKYVKGDVLYAPPFYSPLLHEGYLFLS